MRNKKQLKDILNSLPLNLTFEDVGVIAKRFGFDPISFYLMYNDYVIAKIRSDITEEIEEIEEIIEDWI